MTTRALFRVAGMVAVTAFALLGAACTDEEAGSPTAGEREFTIRDTDIDVARGESFSIVVGDNASVGDDWSLSRKPDAAIVTAEGDDYEADPAENGSNGSGGTRYFHFTAKAEGSTSLELFNCFQGCHTPNNEKRFEIHIEVR